MKVTAEATETVLALKEKVFATDGSLVVARQQLLFQGKVLKDSQTVAELQYNEELFMVCMLKKEKTVIVKPAATTAATTAAVTAAVTPAVVASTSGTSATVAGTPPPAVASAAAPGAPTPAPAPAASPSATPAVAQNFASAESITNLQSFSGAPEADCAAALNAAMGNADLAFTFLTEGIPQDMPPTQQGGNGMDVSTPDAVVPPAVPSSNAGGLEQLRSHPQFHALRTTVQQNPAALPQILQVIGQQSPELLAAIHANEADFLAMMNEPITPGPAPVPTPATAPPSATATASTPGTDAGGMGAGGSLGQNPQALLQMLQTLPPEQRQAFAAQMGMQPEQLQGFMQALAELPPDQLAAMLGGPGGPGGPGAPAGSGHPPGTIQLTQAEMDAVERLESFGFSRQQAAQAYLACDRNEDLAANMLLDGGFNDDEDDYA